MLTGGELVVTDDLTIDGDQITIEAMASPSAVAARPPLLNIAGSGTDANSTT